MDKAAIKSHDMEKLSGYIDRLRKTPRLTYLFLELTTCCNLRCLHCGSSCGGQPGQHIDTQMLFNALDTIAADFKPHTVMICVTGGEPMLHPEFWKIISRINELGFPWGMTTNGTLIDEVAADTLVKEHIGSITISLDGLEQSHDRLRQVSSSWRQAVQAIRILKRKGVPVQTTTVVHRENFHELDDIYALMCSLNVDSWRVVNLEPIGRALENTELLLSNDEFDGLIDYIREKRYSADTPMDVRFGCSHYLSFEAEREVRDNYFICGSGILVGSILCNGDIFSCLDIERLPELVQGNIKADRFSDVWRNRFQVFRQDRTVKCSECLSCKEKAFCRGDSEHTWDHVHQKPMFCRLRKENYYAVLP